MNIFTIHVLHNKNCGSSDDTQFLINPTSVPSSMEPKGNSVILLWLAEGMYEVHNAGAIVHFTFIRYSTVHTCVLLLDLLVGASLCILPAWVTPVVCCCCDRGCRCCCGRPWAVNQILTSYRGRLKLKEVIFSRSDTDLLTYANKQEGYRVFWPWVYCCDQKSSTGHRFCQCCIIEWHNYENCPSLIVP